MDRPLTAANATTRSWTSGPHPGCASIFKRIENPTGVEKRPLAWGCFQALFHIDDKVRRASMAESLHLVLDSGPLSDERNPGPKRLNHLFRVTWLALG